MIVGESNRDASLYVLPQERDGTTNGHVDHNNIAPYAQTTMLNSPPPNFLVLVSAKELMSTFTHIHHLYDG